MFSTACCDCDLAAKASLTFLRLRWTGQFAKVRPSASSSSSSCTKVASWSSSSSSKVGKSEATLGAAGGASVSASRRAAVSASRCLRTATLAWRDCRPSSSDEVSSSDPLPGFRKSRGETVPSDAATGAP